MFYRCLFRFYIKCKKVYKFTSRNTLSGKLKLETALRRSTKHHSFSVPVSGNETGKLNFFLPNFETRNLFSKNYSRKSETFSENRENRENLSLSLSFCLPAPPQWEKSKNFVPSPKKYIFCHFGQF
jgi:hypothetical protein